MQYSKWLFAYASVIGNAHIAGSIPCQDACTVEKYDNFFIATVSDGAGSCKNSHLGSNLVINSSVYHFRNLIERKEWNKKLELPTEVEWHEEAKQTLQLVKEDLDKFSMSNDLEFKSLSCTVIVTAVLKSGLLITHIGDGRAGYCDVSNEWHSMIMPYHGELANQTVFITSEIWNDKIIDLYIESRIVKDEIKAFCMLSDGCEKASFECNLFNQKAEKYYDPNKPYAPFFDPSVNILSHLYKQGKNEEEVNLEWKEFLDSGSAKLKAESDDKTLILGVKAFEEH